MEELNRNIKKSMFWAKATSIIALVWFFVSILSSIFSANHFNSIYIIKFLVPNSFYFFFMVLIPTIILLKFSSRCKIYLSTEDMSFLEKACASQGLFIKYIGISQLISITIFLVIMLLMFMLGGKFEYNISF